MRADPLKLLVFREIPRSKHVVTNYKSQNLKCALMHVGRQYRMAHSIACNLLDRLTQSQLSLSVRRFRLRISLTKRFSFLRKTRDRRIVSSSLWNYCRVSTEKEKEAGIQGRSFNFLQTNFSRNRVYIEATLFGTGFEECLIFWIVITRFRWIINTYTDILEAFKARDLPILRVSKLKKKKLIERYLEIYNCLFHVVSNKI